MRILVVGDWHSELHETVVQSALKALGHDVEGFAWCTYFRAQTPRSGAFGKLFKRIQNKFVAGPAIRRINLDLMAKVRQFQPEMVFIYRGTHIKKRTVEMIRHEVPGCVVMAYNNDDPFAPAQPRYLWRHFLSAVPSYDIVYAYRHHNLAELTDAGARRVDLLRSWYVPQRNHPVDVAPDEQDRFESDIVFVGHFEPDQRLEYLEEIVRCGFHLKLFGPGYDWDPVISKSQALSSQAPVKLVWGDDYNKALCGAKIALCFFSKLNRDTYTRRCFEIPATGTLLLSEYSSDLATLFTEDVEAAFFRTKEEMIEKIRFYLQDTMARQAVASAGQRRVMRDGHDVQSRMAKVVATACEIRHELGTSTEKKT